MPEVATRIAEKNAQWVNPKRTDVPAVSRISRVDKATALNQAKMSVVAANFPSIATREVSAISPHIARPFGTQNFVEASVNIKTPSVEARRPTEGAGTAAWIHYFDTNWKKEKLSQDWYNLKSEQSSKRVGFIMDQQMNLLKNPSDKEALSDWTTKTVRDLEGFKLEFLTDNVVYPRKYRKNPNNPARLEDPMYGKAKDGSNYARISEIVSDQERNGSVRESLERIQEFFATAPDGAIAVMTSPLGPTGFKTQDGLSIDYPDSYFFVMQKNGDEVMNYTIKTDFKLDQCREAVFWLTGIMLPENSALEDYGKALALLNPGQHEGINSVTDVISVFEQVQPSHAFVDSQNNKTTNWNDVREQISKGEDLYRFDLESKAVLSEFEDYAREGTHTKEELHKAISVTILRLGELFFREEGPVSKEVFLEENKWQEVSSQESFGAVLEKTAERRGCSGGGSSTGVVFSVTPRSGVGGSAEDEYGSLDFECSKGHRNTRPRGALIPNCTTCGESVAC